MQEKQYQSKNIIENKVLKLGGGGGRSTQDVYAEIRQGNSERWTIQSQKRKYVNGKLSRVIGVGYSASINNPDYLLEEDKSNNEIQITAQNDGTSGLCILTQNQYFTIKTTGLGSYTLKQISIPLY